MQIIEQNLLSLAANVKYKYGANSGQRYANSKAKLKIPHHGLEFEIHTARDEQTKKIPGKYAVLHRGHLMDEPIAAEQPEAAANKFKQLLQRHFPKGQRQEFHNYVQRVYGLNVQQGDK